MTSEDWLRSLGIQPDGVMIEALDELLADQHETCADEIAKLENIITRAVGWWLLEGQKESIGAPAWVFSARQLIDGENNEGR